MVCNVGRATLAANVWVKVPPKGASAGTLIGVVETDAEVGWGAATGAEVGWGAVAVVAVGWGAGTAVAVALGTAVAVALGTDKALVWATTAG